MKEEFLKQHARREVVYMFANGQKRRHNYISCLHHEIRDENPKHRTQKFLCTLRGVAQIA